METPKNFLMFSQNKTFLIFQETETPKIHIFQETENLKKFTVSGHRAFLYSRKRNFLFGKSILRTLAYLQLEAYSQHWYIQNPRHIQNTDKHLLWNVSQKQLFSALSYIPRNEAFLTNISLIFQEVIVLALKVKKMHY